MKGDSKSDVVEELVRKEKRTDSCLLKSPFMVLESIVESQSSLVLLSARRLFRQYTSIPLYFEIRTFRKLMSRIHLPKI